MDTVRKPAVAGTFYPSDPDRLRDMVDDYLSESDSSALAPKAIVAPHAGYVYSGPIAGTAYGAVRERADDIERVVLLGPSHRVSYEGAAVTAATAYETPLGEVPIDREAVERIESLSWVRQIEEAHVDEHSLEVHVPFLQRLLGSFQLVPIVVGRADPEDVAEILDALWGGDETLIVISSDLSHFHDYETAKDLDRETSEAIVEMDGERVDPRRACGAYPLRGLLLAARERNMKVEVLDLRNSGDTAGDKNRVVGYGAYAFRE